VVGRGFPYVCTGMGWVYHAAVVDLFNKEVIGCALSRNPDTELVERALAQAIVIRKPNPWVGFHSDRGTQYRSRKCQRYLSEEGIMSSLSLKGCTYDNACMESFFATLKKEWVYQHTYVTMKSLESNLFEYVELFRISIRLHSKLG
jgi:putative transposase